MAGNSSCRSQAGEWVFGMVPHEHGANMPCWSHHSWPQIIGPSLAMWEKQICCAEEGTSMCTNTWACTWLLQTPASPAHRCGLSMALIQGGGMPAVSKDPWGREGSSYPSRNGWETHSYPRFCTADSQHRAESFQTDLWEMISPLTPKAFAGL